MKCTYFLKVLFLRARATSRWKIAKTTKTCFWIKRHEVSWIVNSIIDLFNVKMQREVSTIVDSFNLVRRRDREVTRSFFFELSSSSSSSSFRNDISRQTSRKIKKAREIQSTSSTSFFALKTERLKTKFLTETETILSRFEEAKASFINEMNLAITKFNTTVNSLVLMIESTWRSALIN